MRNDEEKEKNNLTGEGCSLREIIFIDDDGCWYKSENESESVVCGMGLG